MSEKIQLEQKLKLQRVELHKQANQMQSAEDRTKAELHELQTATGQHKTAITVGAKNVRAEDNRSFADECSELEKEVREHEKGRALVGWILQLKKPWMAVTHQISSLPAAADTAVPHSAWCACSQLDQAKAALAALREEHKVAEAGLHKSKKRAEQDVEVVIGDYDGDLGSKEEEYQEAYGQYKEVITKLETLTKGYHEMYQERMEYEERVTAEAARRLAEGLVRVRRNRAARVIQLAYKNMKARRAAEAKKKKKAEAAKAKKK